MKFVEKREVYVASDVELDENDEIVQMQIRVPLSFKRKLEREASMLTDVTGSKVSVGSAIMYVFNERDALKKTESVASLLGIISNGK